VDQLLAEREAERNAAPAKTSKDSTAKPRKRKAPPAAAGQEGKEPKAKKAKITKTETELSPLPPGLSRITSVKLKLGPKPKELDWFPCCLCVGQDEVGLLHVQDAPRDGAAGPPSGGGWRAHEFCAGVIPETWVDEVDLPGGGKERVVFGVDGIPKDRWNLVIRCQKLFTCHVAYSVNLVSQKCTACSKSKPRAHGAPIQCTKGKCPKAFHVSCAQAGSCSAVFAITREVEKDIVLNEPAVATPALHDSLVVGMVTPQPEPSAARVLKVIKKSEFSLLCHQHNPVCVDST
jgi:hypothetical protein